MSIVSQKTLGPNLFLIVTDHDPNTVATDAPKGSIIIDVKDTSCWMIKQDDGNTTNVKEIDSSVLTP